MYYGKAIKNYGEALQRMLSGCFTYISDFT